MSLIKKNKVIIDIGTSIAKIIDVNISSNKVVVNKACRVSVENFISGGDISNVKGLVDILIETLKDNNIKGKNLSLITPSKSLKYDIKKIPIMNNKELKEYVDLEMMEIFPKASNLTHSFDYMHFGDVLDIEDSYSMLGLFSIPKLSIQALINEFKLNKYKVCDIDTSVSSLYYLSRLYNDYGFNDKLYIDIGNFSTEFIVLHQGVAVFARSVDKGLKDIKKDIKKKLDIPYEMIDDILMKLGFDNSMNLSDEFLLDEIGIDEEDYFKGIDWAFGLLNEEIFRSLEHIWHNLKYDVNDVVAVGGITGVKSISKYFSDSFTTDDRDVNVESWELVTNLCVNNVNIMNNSDITLSGDFAVALGLATKEVI